MEKTDKQIVLENGLASLKSNDTFFSWRPCEFCNKPIAGSRWDIEFKYNKDDEQIYYASICQDCLEEIFC